MKTLPVIVLVMLIPLAAASSSIHVWNGYGQGQVLPNTSEEAIGNPDLAKCRGTKCAGSGDTIRNGQDVDGTQRFAGSRGGQTTSGAKKGARHLDDATGSRVHLS